MKFFDNLEKIVLNTFYILAMTGSAILILSVLFKTIMNL